MTTKEIKTMIASSGDPCVYHHYPEGKVPALPYNIFYFPEDDNFSADDITYQKNTILRIEHYSDNKDFDGENKLEKVLNDNHLPFRKLEAWIESEKLYQITYETEITINE